jgi:hypothetical protein
MTRTSQRTNRPGLEDLEGRQLLSVASVPTSAPIPVAAHVAPAVFANQAQPNAPTKVTLTVISMWAPAITTFNGQTALAWTGTDLGHHLNVSLLNTGSSLTALPNFAIVTLPERSNLSPSVAAFGGRLYLAWTGLDGRINVESSADGVHFSNKVTLGEFSGSSPALAVFDGRLDLAWTAFDGRINLASSADGVRFGNKVTLNQTSFKPVVIAKIHTQMEMAPALATFDGRLWLAWTGSDPQHHLNTMSSADGINFNQLATYVATSEDGPALAVQHGASAGQPDRLFLGWTGVGNKLLNVMSTTIDAPGFFNPTTLGQTASNGIALNSPAPGTLDIAWAGTDVRYHINLQRQ